MEDLNDKSLIVFGNYFNGSMETRLKEKGMDSKSKRH